MWNYMQDAEKTADEVAKLYFNSARYLQKAIDGIFTKYMTKHGLTEKEAKELISRLYDKTSIQELLQKLQAAEQTEERKKYLREVEAPAYQARIQRLEALQEQIDLIMQNIYRQEKKISTRHYTGLVEKAYYHSVYNIQKRVGLGFSFSHVDQKQIDKAVNSQWSGRNYSSRIWGNTKKLAEDLKEELMVDLITGRTEREAADILAKKFAQGASNARRLIRTESCYLSNQLEMQSYKECGIEKYRYLATLDLRTSEICRELDGKVFLVSEAQPGKNCPPMHPWCRSTTVAVVSEEAFQRMQRRARDPVTGKTYLIPASMNYQEWYAKYVEDTTENHADEKKDIVEKSKSFEQDTREEKTLTKSYIDAISKWKTEATPNSHPVEDLTEYTIDDVLYSVDGKNVKLDYSPKEKAVAELLQREFGGEIKMIPRVLNPQGISTPDYIFRGEAFDLKELSGTSKNLVYNAVSKKARQASNFILDISNCPLDTDEIARQVDYVYWSKHTRFVDKVIVVQSSQVLNVYERIK